MTAISEYVPADTDDVDFEAASNLVRAAMVGSFSDHDAIIRFFVGLSQEQFEVLDEVVEEKFEVSIWSRLDAPTFAWEDSVFSDLSFKMAIIILLRCKEELAYSVRE